jgi:hypothetical protein
MTCDESRLSSSCCASGRLGQPGAKGTGGVTGARSRGIPGDVAPHRVSGDPEPAGDADLSAFAERFILSMKSECLDKLIPLDEGHLRMAVSEFVEHAYSERSFWLASGTRCAASGTSSCRGASQRPTTWDRFDELMKQFELPRSIAVRSALRLGANPKLPLGVKP